jgi:two-component system CheB/CheR fusion protein
MASRRCAPSRLMVMVQDPETAEHSTMPMQAIATGLVDYVLPVEKMAAALVDYIKRPVV